MLGFILQPNLVSTGLNTAAKRYCQKARRLTEAELPSLPSRDNGISEGVSFRTHVPFRVFFGTRSANAGQNT